MLYRFIAAVLFSMLLSGQASALQVDHYMRPALASVIGAVVGIALKFAHQLREGGYVPFGPFLAGGGLAVMFAGAPRVLGWMGWA